MKVKPAIQNREPIFTDGNQTIRIRHQRFDGFDIYTAESPMFKDKLLFHKPAEKDLVIAETFKFLGSKDNLWLCRNIHTDTVHIAPFTRFAQLESGTGTTSDTSTTS